MTDERLVDFDIETARRGLLGCDAVYPYDADQAYQGLRGWLERALARLDAVTKERERVCEFGCGPTGDEYVTPGFGLVPACPVHGWVCVLLDARDERIKAAEADAEALAKALERIANAEHQFHPVAGYIYADKIEKWARAALDARSKP